MRAQGRAARGTHLRERKVAAVGAHGVRHEQEEEEHCEEEEEEEDWEEEEDDRRHFGPVFFAFELLLRPPVEDSP